MAENNHWQSGHGPPPPHLPYYQMPPSHETSPHDMMRGPPPMYGGPPPQGPYPPIASTGSFPPPDFWFDTFPPNGRYPDYSNDPRWIRSAYEPPPPPPEAYYPRKPRNEIYANVLAPSPKHEDEDPPENSEPDAQTSSKDDEEMAPSTEEENATDSPPAPTSSQQDETNTTVAKITPQQPSERPSDEIKMPATPAVSNEEDEDEEEEAPDATTDQQNANGKKKGDSLSLLAKISSQMAPPKNRKPDKAALIVTSPTRTEGGPASPIQNRLRSSPIQTPKTRAVVPPPSLSTPKPITPTSAHYYARPTATAPYEYNPQFNPPPRTYSGYDSRSGSWEQSPALVEERNSFDSIDSAGRYLPPPPPEYYDWRGAPPPQYWEQQQRRDAAFYPRPPYPPYPPYGPPPPLHHHPHHPPMEEQTVLRKKFSWKHYPELERFLIENREEYLKFSSRNYTVEQKQFNNTLTERLISLAEKHGYVFDPEEFNFVAIRDRIRCYYKSYVQTARKRGILLPSDKSKAEKERKAREEAALASVKN